MWKKLRLEKNWRLIYTTTLSSSVLLPISLRQTTMGGHTPTMRLTPSRSDGIDSSPVIMARRIPERDIIQSRCSAPFVRVTINSIMENGLKDSRTEKKSFAGIVLGVANQIWVSQPACNLTHFLNSRRKCQITRATHQKQQQGTSNHP